MSWGNPVYVNGQLVGYSHQADPSLQFFQMTDEKLAQFSAGSPSGLEELRGSYVVNGVPLKSPSPTLPEPWTPPWERGPQGNRANRRRRR